ncbi:MAG: FUSC family protein [Chitinophagales bacterium]|nr:FUSC family protein [Chitinophagales bacterium]MBP9188979.1 FUSC family protein [Chitinophagales bacterium]MBP9705697.1 FUSC family protein [Chitinophagales bacterium]
MGVTLFISENFKELRQFMKSISFTRAVRVGIAVTLPAVIALQFGHLEIGMAMSFGAFWSSPSDATGSFRHKKVGILISAALVMIVSFIKGYLHFDFWLLLSVLGLMTFAIAFISIYGFRASLISFSGLMALALSFPNESEVLEVYQYAVLIGLGGLWYLFLSIIWNLINPKAETEEFLSETFLLTAEFIELRGKLVDPNEDRESLQVKLLKLQSELTDNHETLREILVLTRKTSGRSNYQDKRLLIFVQLVEMLETAIANPVNYNRMDVLFRNHGQYVKRFQDLIFEISFQLKKISEAENNYKKLPKNDKIRQCFTDVKLEIALLHNRLYYEEYLMLQNFIEYQEKQFEKLKRIKWLLGDPDLTEIEFIDRKNAKRFLPLQDYDPNLLVRNFSFKSPIFRHSLRLAATVIIGYALGSIFAFQNPYSILLIVIVIMRPSYGLTRNRAKDRLIGTLIGGAIAFGLVFLIQTPYIYGIMGVISLVIAVSLLQKNYKASATFITLSAVFIYAILSPDVLNLIKFRILDTLVGVGLSYAAMRWLWPTWEFTEINESIEKSVKANKDFLYKITEYYKQKGNIPTSYNIARKEAFLETSNLNAAFQRMTQEPKSKQKELDKVYELVVLNHTFLTSLASLSTYIQNNKTTEASVRFITATETIDTNLERVLKCLNDKKCDEPEIISNNDPVFEDQLPNFKSLEIKNLTPKDEAIVRNLQETHLVWEQLKWMYSISNKMLKLAATVKLN